jgi:hypothetical protein
VLKKSHVGSRVFAAVYAELAFIQQGGSWRGLSGLYAVFVPPAPRSFTGHPGPCTTSTAKGSTQPRHLPVGRGRGESPWQRPFVFPLREPRAIDGGADHGPIGSRAKLIKLHANVSGVCHGDSGPDLLAGTNIILAVNSFGNG